MSDFTVIETKPGGARDRSELSGKASNPKDIVGIRKAPMSTVSAAVMAELGVAMLEGASKYGRHNYRAVGVRSSVYYDGTMRHLMAWWEGEDIDPDTCAIDEQTGEPDLSTGVSHITKAIASLVVLRDAMLQGMVTDDRAPSAKPFFPRLNAAASAIIDRYADRNPRHYTIADTQCTMPLDPEPDPEPGWTSWDGLDCRPVAPEERVEIRMRGGYSCYATAGNISWTHFGAPGDVLAYRRVTGGEGALV